VGAALIELGDAPAAWAALGFAPDGAGEVGLGEARPRLTGRGGGNGNCALRVRCELPRRLARRVWPIDPNN
jgi:hypothetical protein